MYYWYAYNTKFIYCIFHVTDDIKEREHKIEDPTNNIILENSQQIILYLLLTI